MPRKARKGRSPRRKPARLGEKLKKIREHSSLSQEGMCICLEAIDKSLNLVAAQISNFEQNKREPNLLVLLAYAKFARITIDDLANDKVNLSLPKAAHTR